MIKVLHVFSDTNIGGAGRYFFNLLSGWDSSRYELLAACPSGGELERILMQKGIKVFALSGGESSIRPGYVRGIKKIISREKIAIVHTHASFAGRIAGRLSGCRVVMTRHGLGQARRDLFRRAIVGIVSRILTDTIIAISRAVKINLMETGVPENMIKVIYNGIDLTTFENIKPLLKKDFNIKGDPIIGIVARLVPEKGYEFALKALPIVLGEFSNAKLVIIGAGPLRKNLENLSDKLGISEHVEFLGYQENVESLAADFDVFVLPSVSEGLGLSLLEAMALGKPVVATAAGGIPEVVESGVNGFLVPPGDEISLATAVIKVLSSKQTAFYLGQAAQRTVFEKFSARVMAEKTMEIYDNLLTKTGE